MPSWGKPDNAAPPAVKQLRGYKKRVEENRIKVLAERKEKRAKEARRAVAPPKRLVDLRWEPDLMASDTVDLRGRVLRKEEGGNSWTVGSELPSPRGAICAHRKIMDTSQYFFTFNIKRLGE